MARKQIVVSVHDSHARGMHALARELRSHGMQVEEVLEEVGLITGAYEGRLSDLERIAGVAGVEEQPQFQLPPPDSEVQ